MPLHYTPGSRRGDWLEWVNARQTPAEEEAIRRSIKESRPLGSGQWLKKTMARLGWRAPAKPGRPRKRK